jgi:FdhD protein
MMKKFTSRQTEYSETGGIHGAALASSEEIYVTREDIGRHNAVDKIIGASLAQGIDMSDKVLLSTGRVSSEIFSKVLRARIPIVAAIGSPTNQAVKLAKVTNITLVSRLRGGRGEIYSGEQRII